MISEEQYEMAYNNAIATFFHGNGDNSQDYDAFTDQLKTLLSRIGKVSITDHEYLRDREVHVQSVAMHVICNMHANLNKTLLDAGCEWEVLPSLQPYYRDKLLPSLKASPKAAPKSKKNLFRPVQSDEEESEEQYFADLAEQQHAAQQTPPKHTRPATPAPIAKRPKHREMESEDDDDALLNIDLEAIDYSQSSAALAPTASLRTLTTVTSVLKKRGLFGPLDLLRRAEADTFCAYYQTKKTMPAEAQHFSYAFVTYEYYDTPGSTVTHDFVVRCVLHSLEMMAKECVALGWPSLFNAPGNMAAEPVVQAPHPPPQPRGFVTAREMQTNRTQYNNNFSTPPVASFETPLQRQNYAPQFNPPPSREDINNIRNGTSLASTSSFTPVVTNDTPNRVYWGAVLEEMGAKDSIAHAFYQRMGTNNPEVAQAVEHEFTQLKFKCGESMPKKNGVRPRDARGFNIYHAEELDTMKETARKILVSKGFM